MDERNVIAIDGPAASGKTTVGRMLAEKLGCLLLDTGCMYRAATLAVIRQGMDVENETAVTQLAQTITIDIQPVEPTVEDGRLYTTLLNGEDVTWEIRSPDVDKNVSQVASHPGVRREMVRQQRQLAQRGAMVMVGRDIGTVVVPDAPLKFYITASAEERARRRWQEPQKRGHETDYETILADVKRRDAFDSSREHAPMRPADDAIIIDTTGRSPEIIVQELIEIVRSKQVISIR